MNTAIAIAMVVATLLGSPEKTDADVLAEIIVGEASCQYTGEEGATGVALVARNRMKSEYYPDTMDGVSTQFYGRKYAISIGRVPGECEKRIAIAVLSGDVLDFTGGSMYVFSDSDILKLRFASDGLVISADHGENLHLYTSYPSEIPETSGNGDYVNQNIVKF